MKKPLIFLAAFLLVALALPARADWYRILESDILFSAIEPFGSDGFIVVGTSGTILRSEDGVVWQGVESQTSENLEGISDAGSDRIFAVGANGTILRSLDGGNSWEVQAGPTTETLHDIDMATTNIGAAVGDDGTILITENSGLSWTRSDTEAVNNFHGVWQTSSTTIWAVGEAGAILVSTNGGDDWTTRNSGTSETLNDVAFATGLFGFAVGNNGTLIKTENGGTAWSAVELPIDTQDLLTVDVFDVTNVMVAGDGVILSSDDLGLTWTEELFTNTNPLFYDVAAGDNGLTFAVGADDDGGFIDAFDVVPPSAPDNLAIDGGSPTTDSTPRFTWDASTDSTNAIDHYVVEIDDFEWSTDDTDFTVPVVLADGDYTVFVHAVDEAMNAGLASELDFTIEEGTPPPEGIEPGMLLKLTCTNDNVNDPCRAVYFYSSDGARHAFPNEKAYFTWYADFSNITEISSSTMASIALGRNVTYRPGVKMVKFQSVNTVYAVEGPNTLRPIDSEATAEDLYGSNWNQQIDDISDAFFSNYEFGNEINSADDYDKEEQMATYNETDDIF